MFTIDVITRRENAMNHTAHSTAHYRYIAKQLSALEEIDVEADSNLLLWLPENRAAFSTVKTMKIPRIGSEEMETPTHNSVISTFLTILSSRLKSGHPIQVIFTEPCNITQGNLNILRIGGHVVLVAHEAVDLRPFPHFPPSD
jgi:hypothetical protein